ncbi:MAG: glycosyltransferase [Chitinophagales bacterium]|nr:glycosyltransferase [Chitinophagales bacterium]
MPKILRIINRLNLGGPTYNAAYLSKYIGDEFETLLVAGMKDESEASSEFIVENLGLKPHYIKNMYREISPLNDWKAYKEIKKIIEDFKPDIVHTHAAKSGALGRLAAINSGVPVVLHTFHGHVFHSYFNPVKTKVFLTIERYLAKKTSRTIAISNIQKEELCNQYNVAPLSKCEVIPLGFDLDRFQENNEERRQAFRKKYGLQEDEIAIGIIGRLVPIKNHELFIKAFAKAKNQTKKKIKAIIIGDGESRAEVENYVKENNLSYSADDVKNVDVLFTSWIKQIEIALPGLDIVCLTSFNEGTPVSLIEAQAANVPIVSTRVGGIEDIVIENKTALLAQNNNINEFANQLLELVESDTMRAEMSEKGYEHVKSTFSYNTLCKNMNNLYHRLLNEKT